MAHICPKCGCTAYHKDGKDIKNGRIAYRVKCKKCGCRYTTNPIVKNNPNCIYCGNDKTHKAGFNRNGAQRYKCASCNRVFQVYSKRPYRIPEDKRKKILWLSRGGFSNRFIAQYVGVGATTVSRLLKLEKENATKCV